MQYQLIFGTSVMNNAPPQIPWPVIAFPGRTLAGRSGFQINEDIMGRHILLLGGSGCGKTNAFCYTVEALRESMGGGLCNRQQCPLPAHQLHLEHL